MLSEAWHVQEGLEVCEAAGRPSAAPTIERSFAGALVPAMHLNKITLLRHIP